MLSCFNGTVVWCFISNFKNGWQFVWSLKVNAITGEITIDAPRGVEKQRSTKNSSLRKQQV